MKKNYQKPDMKVVQLQQRTHILAGSGKRGAKSITSDDDFTQKRGGWNDDDVDM